MSRASINTGSAVAAAAGGGQTLNRLSNRLILREVRKSMSFCYSRERLVSP